MKSNLLTRDNTGQVPNKDPQIYYKAANIFPCGTCNHLHNQSLKNIFQDKPDNQDDNIDLNHR